jgi:hypothetical protein
VSELLAALVGAVIGSALSSVLLDLVTHRRNRIATTRTFLAILESNELRIHAYLSVLEENARQKPPTGIAIAPPELLRLPAASEITFYGCLPAWILPRLALVDSSIAVLEQNLDTLALELTDAVRSNETALVRARFAQNRFYQANAPEVLARVRSALAALREFERSLEYSWPLGTEEPPRGFEPNRGLP